MRAIENGEKQSKTKQNYVLWEGEEGKHYKAAFGEKRTQKWALLLLLLMGWLMCGHV